MSRRLWSRSKASRLSRHTQCKSTPGASGLREKLLTVLAYCSSVVVERSMRGKLAAKPATSSCPFVRYEHFLHERSRRALFGRVLTSEKPSRYTHRWCERETRKPFSPKWDSESLLDALIREFRVV